MYIRTCTIPSNSDQSNLYQQHIQNFQNAHLFSNKTIDWGCQEIIRLSDAFNNCFMNEYVLDTIVNLSFSSTVITMRCRSC